MDGEPKAKRPRLAEDAEGAPMDTEEPVIKFRNYKPATEEFKTQIIPSAPAEHIEHELKEKLEATPTPVAQAVNLVNLAPRKVDWDLKRDVAPKLEKLERRTQRALAEIVRRRLTEEHANS